MKKTKEKILIEFDVEYDEIEWNGSWIPKTLYKYRDWGNSNHRRILENNAIWVPDSYDFNDPFDCNIPIAYEDLINDDEKAEIFLRRILTNSKRYSHEDLEKEIQKKIEEGKYKNKEFISAYTEKIYKSNKDVTGVFSTTPINNNILMWSHYANSHKGFCVGFDSVKLFPYLGGGGNLGYSTQYPIVSPTDDRETQYRMQNFTKSNHWGYEVEYRLTTFQKTNIEIEIPKEVITEVIFGARISIEYKDVIKKLIKKDYPHVKCFSSIPDAKNFSLNICPDF